MNAKELQEIIHQSLTDCAKANQEEFYNKIQPLISNLALSNEDTVKDLTKSLFDYTMFASELACSAMAKTLISTGILNVSSSDS